MLPPHVIENLDTLRAYIGSLGIPTIPKDTHDDELLCTAFVHRSYAADFTGNFSYNERLEFLGDAILSALVAKNLYTLYPDRAESDLTLYKIALVRAETLADIAKEIGLDSKIFLGNGEEKNHGREKTTILCDCFEALLGYIYLSYGADVVDIIVQKYILKRLHGHTDVSVRSYKTLLQEYIQKNSKATPYYKEEEHPEGFISSVYGENNEVIGMGIGSNKKKAQEAAAQNAYDAIHGRG